MRCKDAKWDEFLWFIYVQQTLDLLFIYFFFACIKGILEHSFKIKDEIKKS